MERGIALERLDEGASLPRHRHSSGYVAVVLEGGYSEAGDFGRYSVRPGDAIVHERFEAHRNDAAATGARILNLPVPARIPRWGRYRVDDPDLLVRLAAGDVADAVAQFGDAATPHEEAEADWPDLLAAELRGLRDFRLDKWAFRHNLAPASVSRGFVRAYGITPRRYRAEARARQAYRMVCESGSSLCAVAADLGFADQAHMNRALRALTGHTPGCCRRNSREGAAPGAGPLP